MSRRLKNLKSSELQLYRIIEAQSVSLETTGVI